MQKKLQLLIIDDDKEFIQDFCLIGKNQFHVESALTGREGLEKLEKSDPDAVVLDLRFKDDDMDGIEILAGIRRTHPDIPVIMATDYADVETAVEAMKLGAVHYTGKHPNLRELHAIIVRELDAVRWKLLYRNHSESHQDRLIGDSPAMQKIREIIRRVSAADVAVLIEGENGTGKDLIAAEIHRQSERANAPYVPINCSAVPVTLFESELFGHEKGSFTGAVKTQKGKFELAHDGTIFLDEVTSMAMENQAKLLRALENKSITRVGGKESIEVNVRVIAAGNRDFQQMIDEGSFRQDLFYRLQSIHIKVPPLWQRRQDIPLLIDYFNRYFARFHKQVEKRFTEKAMNLLCQYDWPGNVRQLKSLMQSLHVLAGPQVDVDDLAIIDEHSEKVPDLFQQWLDLPYDKGRTALIQSFQRHYVQHILDTCDGNVTHAAEKAGIRRTSLYRMIRNLGME
jgi:DNA-binding NtrC family response regulator